MRFGFTANLFQCCEYFSETLVSRRILYYNNNIEVKHMLPFVQKQGFPVAPCFYI